MATTTDLSAVAPRLVFRHWSGRNVPIRKSTEVPTKVKNDENAGILDFSKLNLVNFLTKINLKSQKKGLEWNRTGRVRKRKSLRASQIELEVV